MPSLAGRRHSPRRVTDRGRLARDLARAVRGEVRFDRGSQALYAGDASVYRQVPIGVVVPRDADDAVSALAVCRDHDVPVHQLLDGGRAAVRHRGPGRLPRPASPAHHVPGPLGKAAAKAMDKLQPRD